MGIVCLFRTHAVQAFTLRVFSRYPIVGVLTYKRGLDSPYYLLLLKVVGVGWLVQAGLLCYIFWMRFLE
jgi:hypothetical protein